MKTVIITGSTRGLGYGLADSFLSRGCGVVISGRTEDGVAKAVDELVGKHATESVHGVTCDVTSYERVRNLWNAGFQHFGRVDCWINNAGISTVRKKLWEHPPSEIRNVVGVNLVGTIYGCKVAFEQMTSQGFGAIYNVEGMGSNGQRVSGLSLYGTSKYGLRYFNEALAEESKDSPVIVGALSPGMLVTDLLTSERDADFKNWEKTKRVLNILADRVETVAPWLVDKILENKSSGVNIRWLTRGKILWRFMSAPLIKRDVIG